MSNRDHLIRLMYDMRQGGSTIEETADAVLEWVHNHFDSKPIYKVTLRAYLIEGLRVLDRAGPVDITKIAIGSGLGGAARSHFGQFIHFDLIEKKGELYSLTSLGRDFLAGTAAIPEWIWQRKGTRLPPPPGEKDGPLRYIHEFKQDSPKDYQEVDHLSEAR